MDRLFQRHRLPDVRVFPAAIALLCIGAAWLRGGTRPPIPWLLVLLAVLPCLAIPFSRREDRRRVLSAILHDRFFHFGGALLLVVAAQWINSGYGTGTKGLTPSPWLPWSVDSAGGSRLLQWFFPAWVAVLLVRHVLDRSGVRLLLRLLAWNGALLALVGLVQHVCGARRMLGVWNGSADFFATFDYPNHAAAWFYMNAALAVGLAHDSLKRREPSVRFVVWIVCFLLCCAAAVLTLSRVGAFAASLLGTAVAWIFVWPLLRRASGTAALNAGIALLIIVATGLALFLGAGGGSLAKEVKGKSLLGRTSLVGDIEGRIEQMPAAWALVRRYPLFGTGGEGYRWLAQDHVTAERWAFWSELQRENVHCDPVQFLSELGTVGFACMAGALAVLVRSVAAAGRIGTLARWLSAGLAMAFIHGFIDFPFRCPAIFLEWSCLLAALPAMAAAKRS